MFATLNAASRGQGKATHPGAGWGQIKHSLIRQSVGPELCSDLPLTGNKNRTRFLFRSKEPIMVRSVFEEAVTLASLSLFLATVAVWAQVLGML